MTRTTLASCLLLLNVIACTPQPESDEIGRADDLTRLDRPIPTAPSADSPLIQIRCSRTQIRTPVAEITLPRSASLAQTRIDATVYPDGFRKARFAALFPFQPIKTATLAEGLRNMDARPLSVLAASVDTAAADDLTVLVRVLPLEANLTYSWRVVQYANGLVTALREVRTQVLPCIADLQDEKN